MWSVWCGQMATAKALGFDDTIRMRARQQGRLQGHNDGGAAAPGDGARGGRHAMGSPGTQARWGLCCSTRRHGPSSARTARLVDTRHTLSVPFLPPVLVCPLPRKETPPMPYDPVPPTADLRVWERAVLAYVADRTRV